MLGSVIPPPTDQLKVMSITNLPCLPLQKWRKPSVYQFKHKRTSTLLIHSFSIHVFKARLLIIIFVHHQQSYLSARAAVNKTIRVSIICPYVDTTP